MARFTLLLALLATSACTLGPDHVAPEPELPPGWTAELERGLEEGATEIGAWWTKLRDPELDRLVAEVVSGNLDLRIATERIDEARELRLIAATGRLPSVDLNLSYRRQQNSQENPFGSFLPRVQHFHENGFDASWELDLWGRIARGVEAAEAGVDAVIEDRRDLLTILVAEAAIAYVDLRAFQERLRIARANLDIQSRTVELSETRYQSGLVSQLDVAQARSLLETTRASIAPLEAGLRASKNRLAVLRGTAPGTLEKGFGMASSIPVPAKELAVGVPADVLVNRADVRRAERELAAQTARIGVAEAELYPRVSLVGSLGVESDDFLSQFARKAVGIGIGPQLSFNVFDRERLHAGVRIENARQRAALLAFEQTVLLALEEVENAMTVFVREQVRRDSLLRAVEQARIAVRISKDQYREGLVDFQGVLESQRSLFQLEDDLTLNAAAITTAMIRLYKALGGGWKHFESQPEENE